MGVWLVWGSLSSETVAVDQWGSIVHTIQDWEEKTETYKHLFRPVLSELHTTSKEVWEGVTSISTGSLMALLTPSINEGTSKSTGPIRRFSDSGHSGSEEDDGCLSRGQRCTEVDQRSLA